MRRIPSIIYRQSTRLIGIVFLVIILGIIRWFFDGSFVFTQRTFVSFIHLNNDPIFLYQRAQCSCTRPVFGSGSSRLILDESSTSLCSQYSTFRGFHQKIIAISMYGPKENTMFNMNTSLNFLDELIIDMKKTYPNWILRIYHDNSIGEAMICPIECAHQHVDFCNINALTSLGNLEKTMPPKIWRFLPAGDLLVDVMASRDLDSPLSERELHAVNEWLSSNKSWHVMRDHPFHSVPMLGGLWGFRPAFNRTFARMFLGKILDPISMARYGGRGDQSFLGEHIWPHIQNDLIAHDSHLCKTSFGANSRPWPTRRPSLNDSDCFVGCIRPCCPLNQFPFGECPLECRPKDHPDWTMC